MRERIEKRFCKRKTMKGTKGVPYWEMYRGGRRGGKEGAEKNSIK